MDHMNPSEETDEYWLYATAPIDKDATYGPSGGKWMVYVYVPDLDHAWATIREATRSGTLGPSSKSGTARANPNDTAKGAKPTKVICVYTRDAEDRDDLGRVFAELRRLGFAGQLSYKTDADTQEGTYGKGSSLYTSAPGSLEFHTPKSRNRRRISTRTKPCVYCGASTDHIMSQPTPDGRHSMAICEDCMVSRENMPESGRWSNRAPGGYVTQPCPECAAPEGLIITTAMIEFRGMAVCQGCNARIRR